jgi:hypothetical protein
MFASLAILGPFDSELFAPCHLSRQESVSATQQLPAAGEHVQHMQSEPRQRQAFLRKKNAKRSQLNAACSIPRKPSKLKLNAPVDAGFHIAT